MFASSSRIGARPSSIIRSMRACASRTLEISLRGPNCGLFPQGPIIPVPTSSSPYRPVGICGNNWAVSPGGHAKRKPSNQRVRRPLFPLFRWRLCSMAMPKQHQAVLGSTKTRVQKPVSVVPTRWLKTASSLSQFVPVYSIYTQSQKCPRIHGIKSGSRFFGSPGPFSWVTLGHGKLRAATYGAHGRYIPREGKAEKLLQTLS